MSLVSAILLNNQLKSSAEKFARTLLSSRDLPSADLLDVPVMLSQANRNHMAVEKPKFRKFCATWIMMLLTSKMPVLMVAVLIPLNTSLSSACLCSMSSAAPDCLAY